MRHSMKPDLRADYKIRLYTGPKTPFFEVSTFVSGNPARCASRLVGVNKSTGADDCHRLREIIALALQLGAEADVVFGGEIAVDERDFGGRRQGQRGRGSSG